MPLQKALYSKLQVTTSWRMSSFPGLCFFPKDFVKKGLLELWSWSQKRIYFAGSPKLERVCRSKQTHFFASWRNKHQVYSVYFNSWGGQEAQTVALFTKSSRHQRPLRGNRTIAQRRRLGGKRMSNTTNLDVWEGQMRHRVGSQEDSGQTTVSCPEWDILDVFITLQPDVAGLFLQWQPWEWSLLPERAVWLEERGLLLPWMVSFKVI